MAKINDSTNLRKLKKKELLEIMLAQSREIDDLRSQVETLQKQLEERTLHIKNAGSIAEASLAVTKIFEEAQKAANLLGNVSQMVDEDEKSQDES